MNFPFVFLYSFLLSFEDLQIPYSTITVLVWIREVSITPPDSSALPLFHLPPSPPITNPLYPVHKLEDYEGGINGETKPRDEGIALLLWNWGSLSPSAQGLFVVNSQTTWTQRIDSSCLINPTGLVTEIGYQLNVSPTSPSCFITPYVTYGPLDL